MSLTFTKVKTFAILLALVAGFLGELKPVQAADFAVAPKGVEVAAGQQSVTAIDANGKVWTWGRIYPGLGGIGTTDTLTRPSEVFNGSNSFNAINIASAGQSYAVVTASGEVYSWGSSGYGLGDGLTGQASRNSAVKVSFPSGVKIVEVSGRCEGYIARSSDGAIYQWGSFYSLWNLASSTPRLILPAGSVTGETSARVLSRGCSSAFVLTQDGGYYAWGSNGGGVLGNGNISDSTTPIKVNVANVSFKQISASNSHVLALTASGQVYGWGGNSYGQLALNPATSFSSSPRRIGNITDANFVLASDSGPYSSYISNSGGLYQWGTYYGSWSGPDSYSVKPAQLPNDLTFTLVKGDSYSSGMTFVASDGSIWSKNMNDSDGNCGVDATQYSMWINGKLQPSRNLVRVFSDGQFGQKYVEDSISINALKNAAGSRLSLDGSSLINVEAGQSITVTAEGPQSLCFDSSSLSFSWELTGDGEYNEIATLPSDVSADLVISGEVSTTSAQSRQRGGLKIVNPDGYSKIFNFDFRINAVQTSQPVSNSSLPYVSSNAAVGTNGKIYTWGVSDFSAGSTSLSPVLLAVPDPNLQFSKVETAANSFSNTTFNLGVGLSQNGKLYVFGAGPLAHPGEVDSKTVSQISRVDVAVEVSSPFPNDPVTDFVILNSAVVALTNSGKIWFWKADNVSNQYETLGPTTNNIFDGTNEIAVGSNGLLYRLDSTWYEVGNWYLSANFPASNTSIAQIAADSSKPFMSCVNYSNNSCSSQYVSLKDGWYVTNNGTTIPSIAGQVKELSTREIRVILSDGTVWKYQPYERSWFKEWEFSSVKNATRFAGNKTQAVIGSTGEIFIGSNYGSNFGTCSRSWDGSNVMHSDGNLGPERYDDFQELYVTSESPIDSSFAWANNGKVFGPDSGGIGNTQKYLQSLRINPSQASKIYINVFSSCVNSNELDISVDKDDDGIFESTLSVNEIDPSTFISTNMGYQPSPKRGQSQVDLDLSTPGGRYIGVKVTSKNVYNQKSFSTETRIPILVEPVKPAGKYSTVSINNGSEFSESTDVTLNLAWPVGAVTADISNDGGFKVSRNVPLKASVPWKISSQTTGKLGSAVYVKFLGLVATIDGSWEETDLQPGPPYTDNITLDLNGPNVSSVGASKKSVSTSSLSALNSALINSQVSIMSDSNNQDVTVSIDATDDISGIKSMQITSDPAVPGPEIPYQSVITIPVTKDSVAVRVKDAVGNWSEWTYTSIEGFVYSPPTQPVTPPVVVPPVPVQPVVPKPQAPINSAPVAAPAPAAAPAGPSPVSKGAKVAAASVASNIGMNVPAKSKVIISVAKSSKKICTFSGGRLNALTYGNCTVTVTVTAPKPSAVTVVGSVPISKNQTLSSLAIASQIGANVPSGSKITLSVAGTSKNVCSASGSKVKGKANGSCSVKVKIQAPQPKPVKQTTTLSVS